MRPAKSANSLAANKADPAGHKIPANGSRISQLRQEGDESSSSSTQNNSNINHENKDHPTTSPICRCRVMYLGSSVPHITKDGLQGIQEPLRELYPDEATLASGNAGIDSWLSVWSNGILIENVDDSGREVKRFFKIDALHYCAAVKYVQLSAKSQNFNPYTTLPNPASLANFPKFLPLDSPHARQTNQSPPIFASILRRTTGIKVLECHAFICKREAAANALVRCCFHAYADTMYAKQIGADITAIAQQDINNNNTNVGLQKNLQRQSASSHGAGLNARKARSVMALNEESKRSEPWRAQEMHYAKSSLTYRDQMDASNQMVRRKSIDQEHGSNGLDNRQQYGNENMLRQQKLSKSMHHLNQNGANFQESTSNYLKNPFNDYEDHQSISASCIDHPTDRHPDSWLIQQVNQQSYFNPYTSRVPSYPPQNLIDSQNNGGTMRSIKSLAANSIASTLLRSKKHAKAMSMAHLNNQEKMMSNQTGQLGPNSMIPVPPMFLPNLPMRHILNGSQTMKPLSRPSVPLVGPPAGFETMTPKEIKKLLKKSSKYGLDPSKFPFLQPAHQSMLSPFPPPPPPGPLQSKSGTLVSQSNHSDIYDLHPIGLPMPTTMCEQPKPILMKPNSEFLKSKAGKKWVKQQKQFKKLLPPHLDGLPIIFGPPPIEALEAANVPNNVSMPMPTLIPPHPSAIPMMDAAGFYNPNPFYGQQNGSASSASTLLRYSPHSQMMTEHHHNGAGPGDMMNGAHYEAIYQARGLGNGATMDQQAMLHGQKGYISDDSSIMNSGGHYSVHGRPTLQGHANHVGYLPERNQHMVEQSVISLGDENDYDEEQDISNGQYQDYMPSQSGGNHMGPRHSNGSKVSAPANNYQQIKAPTYESPQQMAYNQQMSQQLADDQSSSYSSGLYKREHISERAFSYSIRQEHRSNGRKNPVEHGARNEPSSALGNGRGGREHRPGHEERHLAQTRGHSHKFQQQQAELEAERQNGAYYAGNTTSSNPQNIPMDELSARLEDQLNMKSFADGRQIKSHM